MNAKYIWGREISNLGRMPGLGRTTAQGRRSRDRPGIDISELSARCAGFADRKKCDRGTSFAHSDGARAQPGSSGNFRTRAPRKYYEKVGVWRRLPFPFQAREKVSGRAKNKTEWTFGENLNNAVCLLTENIYEISESMRQNVLYNMCVPAKVEGRKRNDYVQQAAFITAKTAR